MSRTHFFMCAFALICFTLFGQKKPDLTTATKANIDSLYKYSESIYETDQDSAYAVLEAGKQLAKKISCYEALTKMEGLHGYILYETGDVIAAEAHFKNELQLADQYKLIDLKVQSLNHFGELYMAQGKYQEALTYFRKTEKLTRGGNQKLRASAMNFLGSVMEKLNKSDSAIFYFQQGLTILKKLKGEEGQLAVVSNNLANVYRSMGQFEYALKNFLEAATVFEKCEDFRAMAAVYSNIGFVFFDRGDFKKAEQYMQRSYGVAIKSNNPMGQATALNNLGSVYQKLNKYDLAIETYKKCLKVAEETNMVMGIAISLNNIGNCYVNTERYKEALPYIERSLKIKLDNGLKSALPSSYMSLGKVNLQLKNYKIAAEMFNKVLDANKGGGELDTDAIAKFGLAKAYYGMKNYSECSKLLFEYCILKDSLSDKDKLASLDEIEGKYQNERKQLEIDNLKKDEVLKAQQLSQKSAEIKHQTQLRNAFIAGFSVLLILAFFVYRGYIRKKKDNLIIAHQKMQVEEKQKEVLDSIQYARKIQNALITNEQYIARNLNRLKAKAGL